jgi:hypothetical protein
MRAIECGIHKEVFSSVVMMFGINEQSKSTASKYKVAGLMISCMYGLAHKRV